MSTAHKIPTPTREDLPLASDGGSQAGQGSGTKNDKGLDGAAKPTESPASDDLISDGGSSGDQGGGTKNEPEKGLDGE